jgi:hypothetical protein
MEESVKDKNPEDYEGKPHHEKAIHHTHFTAPGVRLRRKNDPFDEKYEWVEVRPGRFKRQLKEWMSTGD